MLLAKTRNQIKILRRKQKKNAVDGKGRKPLLPFSDELREYIDDNRDKE